jgi:hypothetical protein
MHGDDELHPVQAYIAMMSASDVHPEQAPAFAMSRSGVEITGATERTVAVFDPFSFQAPHCAFHDRNLLSVPCFWSFYFSVASISIYHFVFVFRRHLKMTSRRVEKIAEWSLFLQVVQNRA